MSPRASHVAVHARLPWPGTDGVPEVRQREIAPRQTLAYLCPHCGYTFARVFAADAAVPVTQDCRRCWRPARLEGAPPDGEAAPPALKRAPGQHQRPAAEDTTPWGQLMKRRSREDGEVLLAEGRERRRQTEAAQ
jgi:hypothetical protein